MQTDRNQQSAWRTFAAIALASTISFACTTNRNPGNGQPTGTTAPAASPAATPGSSSGTTNPPMASSVSPAVGRSVGGTTPATDALAVAAANQGYRGARVLGPVNPSGAQKDPAAGATTGYFNPPSQYTNPQQSANSSISSAPTPIITSGAEGDGVIFTDVAASAAVAGSGTIATNVTPTTSPTIAGATTSSSAGTGLTPTTAAVANGGTGVSTPGAVPSGLSNATARAIAANPSLANPANTTPGVTVGQTAAGPGGRAGALTPTVSSAAITTPTVADASSPSAIATSARTPSATVPVISNATIINNPSSATTAVTAPTVANHDAGTLAERTRAKKAVAATSSTTAASTSSNSATGEIVVTTNENGKLTVTNVKSATTGVTVVQPSRFRRFLSVFGIGNNTTTTTTTTPSSTTTQP